MINRFLNNSLIYGVGFVLLRGISFLLLPLYTNLLNTFDAYSPKYASTHTFPEVYNWFRNAGLEKIQLLGKNSICIRGWKVTE